RSGVGVEDECVHGMNPAWCATCRGVDEVARDRRGEDGFSGGSKQELLNQVCDAIGVKHVQIGVGSSLPSEVFDAAAAFAGVRRRSMPEIGEAIARKAGVSWGPDCDSRGSASGGGSTVTREGLGVLIRALSRLAPRDPD